MADAIKPHDFADGETIDALRQNENFDALFDWISNEAMHRDASTAFDAFPTAPGAGAVPSDDAELANKLYVDSMSNAVYAKAPEQSDASGSFDTLHQITGFSQQGEARGATVSSGGITLTSEGLWICGGTANWGSNGNGKRRLRFYKNGSSTEFGKIESAEDYSTVGEGFRITLVAPFIVSSNTVISLWAAQNSGSTLDVTTDLWAFKVI